MSRKPRRARQNRSSNNLSVDRSLGLNEDALGRGAKAYEDWHWGENAAEVVDWNDDDMPPMLIECGRLIRLHVRAPGSQRHPRRQRDAMIQLARSVSDMSHVAYDPEHPHERLYLLVNPKSRKALADHFWQQNSGPTLPLVELAHIAGGRHAREDYPDVMVKPIGVLTAVVYLTTKRGDGKSYYIHHMGEMSHHFPILAVDQHGRLWMAGGNYVVPSPGITD